MVSIRTQLLGYCMVILLSMGCGGGEDNYSDTMAEQHRNDTPEATAIVMEPRIPVRAQSVIYGQGEGQDMIGYMAVPVRPDSVAEAHGLAPGDTSLPAVLVIHEWWGLNENIKAMTRRLAGEGYRALAVDLYKGQVAETPDEARGIMDIALQDQGRLVENLQSAYRFVEDTYGSKNVGVIGWCFGGAMALNAGLTLPDELDAMVIYYGRVGDASRDQLSQLDMPVLSFFGGKDESIPLEDVRNFETTLNELGKEVQVFVYEDAGHAFANPSGQNYVPDAATDAWSKTVNFLEQHLY